LLSRRLSAAAAAALPSAPQFTRLAREVVPSPFLHGALLLGAVSFAAAGAATATASAGDSLDPSSPSTSSSASAPRPYPFLPLLALLGATAEAKETAAAPSAAETEAELALQRQPKGMTPTSEIVLYQYEVCPFCCKVKAVLDYYKLPYRVVEVDPLRKKEIRWSKYRKVPILTIDGEQINDSSVIIDRLYNEVQELKKKEAAQSGKKSSWFSLSSSSSSSSSSSGSQSPAEEEEAKWRRWVDEHFVRVVTVNIYRNARESMQTFDYITEHGNFSWWNRQSARVVSGDIRVDMSTMHSGLPIS
jgi:microsomal prostaglandin-E synthase 2